MRARQRHFNPKTAGADLVLDARYINQANNTAVSTWADRSGNGYDATQATGAYQPTFLAAQLGGNPVVRFSGGQGLAAIIGNRSNYSFSLLHISTSGSGEFRFACVNATATKVSTIFGLLTLADSIAQNVGNTSNFLGLVKDGVAWGTQTGNYTNNVWTHALATHDSSVMRLYVNGSTSTIASNSQSPTGGTVITLGALFSPGDATVAGANMDIASARNFASVISEPLRKRCDHAAAFSFKIACS